MRKDYNYLSIIENRERFEGIEEKVLKIPGQIKFGDYIIEAIESDKIVYNKNNFYTNLKIGDELLVRSKQDGDRIVPMGMKNYKKVKDILINEKVPKEERENIPIVIFKNEIIWIAGVKGSENYKNLERGNCIKLNIRRSIS